MAKENETIADIITEKRREANYIVQVAQGKHHTRRDKAEDEAHDILREADRIEAAWRRETQAHKKELKARDAVIQTEVAAREAERDAHKREMKETVRRVSQVAEEMTRGTAKGVAPTMKDVDEWAVRLYDTIDITLLAPARNCDRFATVVEARKAHRREKAEWVNANAGLAKLVDIEKLGDAAKLREALIKAITMLAVCEWPDGTNMEGVEELRRDIDAALDAPPRNCDVYTADELKAIFKSELVSELPIANEHEKNIAKITAFGVIDTLLAPATEKKGCNDGNE